MHHTDSMESIVTTIDMRARYANATTCECGALIECLDGGGYSYWLHVKRMRIEYDHAAVPNRPRGELVAELVEKLRNEMDGLGTEDMSYLDGFESAIRTLEGQ